jgi:hypothetical protein
MQMKCIRVTIQHGENFRHLAGGLPAMKKVGKQTVLHLNKSMPAFKAVLALNRFIIPPPKPEKSQHSVQEGGALVGLAEVAKMLDTSTQNVCNMRKRYKDFPSPITELRQGPIWFTVAITAWSEDQDA